MDPETEKLIEEMIEDESVSDAPDDADYSPQTKRRKRVQNRAKISHVWTHEEIVKLISEVEVRPCIWNAANKEYKNRFKRDTAWQEVLSEIGEKYPIDELMSKWQNLRTQFRNSVTSAKKIKSGQATSNKPN